MSNPFRRLKFSYQLYNFFHKKQLQHNLPLFKKYGIKKRYFDSLSSQDFIHLSGEKNKYDRLDTAEHLTQESDYKTLSPSTQQELLPWSKDGYVVLKNFFDPNRVDQFNAEVQKIIDNKEVNKGYQEKIMFAIHQSDILKRAGEDPQLLKVLNLLMGKEVDLFQSINFLKGSQQRSHSDSVHMTTFPYGNLIAVWVALEDITADSGPLHYYPGSHTLPYIMNADYDNVGSKTLLGDKLYSDYEDRIAEIITENKLTKKIFLPKKGDILIWHANLLHGGEPMNDPNGSRKSMVFHYYTQDAICYHEISQRPTLK